MDENNISTKELMSKNEKFISNLTKEIGEPQKMTDSEVKRLVEKDYKPYAKQRPYLIVNLKEMKIVEACGFDLLLGWPQDHSMEHHFKMVHQKYLKPYIQWAQAAYKLAINSAGKLQPLSHSYRVSLPLFSQIDRKYYWANQQATPIQFDATGKMVTHINYYDICEEWSELTQKPFDALIWANIRPDEAKMAELKKLVITDYILEYFKNEHIYLLRLFVENLGEGPKYIHKYLNTIKHKETSTQYYNLLCAQIVDIATKNLGFKPASAREFAIYCSNKGFLDYFKEQDKKDNKKEQ